MLYTATFTLHRNHWNALFYLNSRIPLSVPVFEKDKITLELYPPPLPPRVAPCESYKEGMWRSNTSTISPSMFYGKDGRMEGDLSPRKVQTLSNKRSNLVRGVVICTQSRTGLQGSGYEIPPCRSLRDFRGTHWNLKRVHWNILPTVLYEFQQHGGLKGPCRGQ